MQYKNMDMINIFYYWAADTPILDFFSDLT